jgi:hypothetical protein
VACRRTIGWFLPRTRVDEPNDLATEPRMQNFRDATELARHQYSILARELVKELSRK